MLSSHSTLRAASGMGQLAKGRRNRVPENATTIGLKFAAASVGGARNAVR